jgi:hypothetical protein
MMGWLSDTNGGTSTERTDRVSYNFSPVFDTPDDVARLRLAANQKSESSGDVEIW